MQIDIADECNKYQIVKYEGNFYALRRLGFELNCAPEIMKAVVYKVLSLDEDIFKATDHYYDDIIVKLDVTSVENVRKHLLKFGLVTRPAENVSSTKVLALQTYKKKGVVCLKRTELEKEMMGNSSLDDMTKRQVFSLCEKLVGHYPVVGWLRVASSFVKRGCQGTALADQWP